MKTQQEMQAEIEELDRILTRGLITTVFQPIVSLKNGEILGYEALSRCESTVLPNPTVLFQASRQYNMLWDLEYMCRISALKSYSSQKGDKLLFINVDPHVVNDEKFKKGFTLEFLREFDMKPSDTVLEITENSYVEDNGVFQNAVNNYKEQSYNIAIDDTGSGFSGLNLITEIQPKYIKLDINLIRDVDKSKLKSSLVHALASFARDCNIHLIAEGVETLEEMKTLIELGVDYGQGFYLTRPNAQLLQLPTELAEQIKKLNTKAAPSRPFSFPAGMIAKHERTLSIADKGKQADEVFKSNPDIYGIPVLDGTKVAGLLSRSSFYYQLGTKFGYDLFLNRTISIIMDKASLIVDYYTDIDMLCASAMARSVDRLYNSIVVTKNEQYYGMLSVKNILEKVSELKIENAKHLNPLTYLPGNVIIENRLSQMLEVDHQETILYLDIDNFKAYNDKYGTLKGDRFLTFVADCITQACAYFGRDEEIFIGHVGGDDFIMTAPNEIAYTLGLKIISVFEEKKANLYCDEALRDNGIQVKNRSGKMEMFPLATLSIAGVQCVGNTCRSIYTLTEDAAIVKKECKRVPDNCVIIRDISSIGVQ